MGAGGISEFRTNNRVRGSERDASLLLCNMIVFSVGRRPIKAPLLMGWTGGYK